MWRRDINLPRIITKHKKRSPFQYLDEAPNSVDGQHLLSIDQASSKGWSSPHRLLYCQHTDPILPFTISIGVPNPCIFGSSIRPFYPAPAHSLPSPNDNALLNPHSESSASVEGRHHLISQFLCSWMGALQGSVGPRLPNSITEITSPALGSNWAGPILKHTLYWPLPFPLL